MINWKWEEERVINRFFMRWGFAEHIKCCWCWNYRNIYLRSLIWLYYQISLLIEPSIWKPEFPSIPAGKNTLPKRWNYVTHFVEIMSTIGVKVKYHFDVTLRRPYIVEKNTSLSRNLRQPNRRNFTSSHWQFGCYFVDITYFLRLIWLLFCQYHVFSTTKL